ncbi:MAG: hypothetical protein QQN44_01795 [Nitrosopumilus sp.]
MTEEKVAKDIGSFPAYTQESIEKLVESIIDSIYKLTEIELTKIYPEKNWYEDNFASNLFSMALQICGGIQIGMVHRRANEVDSRKITFSDGEK